MSSKGIFIGYALRAGGGWTEDLLVPDAEELKNNTAPEVHVKIVKGKEGRIQTVGEQCIFPRADGSNHHTSNLSRSYSNLVEDIRGRLLGEEDDGLDSRDSRLCIIPIRRRCVGRRKTDNNSNYVQT